MKHQIIKVDKIIELRFLVLLIHESPGAFRILEVSYKEPGPSLVLRGFGEITSPLFPQFPHLKYQRLAQLAYKIPPDSALLYKKYKLRMLWSSPLGSFPSFYQFLADVRCWLQSWRNPKAYRGGHFYSAFAS